MWAYLATFAGMYAVMESGGLITAHATQHRSSIEFCTKKKLKPKLKLIQLNFLKKSSWPWKKSCQLKVVRRVPSLQNKATWPWIRLRLPRGRGLSRHVQGKEAGLKGLGIGLGHWPATYIRPARVVMFLFFFLNKFCCLFRFIIVLTTR